MNTTDSSATNAIDRVWDKDIEFLSGQGVKSSVARWYVFRAEQYIKGFSKQAAVRP